MKCRQRPQEYEYTAIDLYPAATGSLPERAAAEATIMTNIIEFVGSSVEGILYGDYLRRKPEGLYGFQLRCKVFVWSNGFLVAARSSPDWIDPIWTIRSWEGGEASRMYVVLKQSKVKDGAEASPHIEVYSEKAFFNMMEQVDEEPAGIRKHPRPVPG